MDQRIVNFNAAAEKVLQAAIELEEAKKELRFRFKLMHPDDQRERVKEYSVANRL
jgi:hypothetical protein